MKTFKMRYNIVLLCLLYGNPLLYLQSLLQCRTFKTLIAQYLYKIVKLMISWQVVVSKLCTNNSKMINVSRRG